MPAASRSRTTSARRRAPSTAAPESRRASCSTRTRAVDVLGERPCAEGDVGAARERQLDALAADLTLELVGRALRDRAAVVDHGDHVGEEVGLLEVLSRQQQRRALASAAG